MAVSLLAAVAFTLVTGDFTIFFAWVLPALLVSEPAHFLIELPEHFGLNTQTNDDGFTNTRTVVGSPLSRWYTNFNNLHTAHHLAPTVPLAHIRQLTAMSADRLVVVERSYWSFYRAVFRGDLRPDRD
jgi:fatty acid desaturase